jgi:hypothetical protein
LHTDHLHLDAPGQQLDDCDRALGEAFCFGIVAQTVVQARQGVQDISDIGMVRAGGAFYDGERLPAERDGLLEPSLSSSRDGQIVEADGFVQGVEPSTLSRRLLGWLRR